MLQLKNIAFASFSLGLLASSSIALAQNAPPIEQPPPAVEPVLVPVEPVLVPVERAVAPSIPTYATGKPADPAATPPPTTAIPTFQAAPGKGVTFSSSDGNYSMMIRPRIQLRATETKNNINGGINNGDTLEVQVRTMRLIMAGNVFTPELKYYIQLAFGGGDFDSDSSSPIYDAFLEYTKFRDFNIRVGQYFVPFDRARTTREFGLQFVDRQYVVREFSLDRDLGIMLSSQDLLGLGNRLGYHLFVGSGDGKNRFANSKNQYGPQTPGMLVVGRLVLRPFGAFDDDLEGDTTRTPHPKLLIGAAGAYNISSDRSQSTLGTTYTVGTFNYAHAEADLVFKWKGFSAFTEFLYRDANKKDNVGIVSGSKVTEYSRSGYGYFAQVGQMLTGKLEVVARAETLKGRDAVLRAYQRTSGRQVGGGLNLYLNSHFFKFQTDYFYIFGDDTSNGQHVARFQIDATF